VGPRKLQQAQAFKTCKSPRSPWKGLEGFGGKYRIQPVLTGIVYVLSAWAVLCLGWYGFLEQKAKKGGGEVCRREEKG